MAGVALLFDLAVQARDQFELLIGLDLVGGDHPGAKATGVFEVLARGDLLGVELPLADAAVVVASVARNWVGRARTGSGDRRALWAHHFFELISLGISTAPPQPGQYEHRIRCTLCSLAT